MTRRYGMGYALLMSLGLWALIVWAVWAVLT